MSKRIWKTTTGRDFCPHCGSEVQQTIEGSLWRCVNSNGGCAKFLTGEMVERREIDFECEVCKRMLGRDECVNDHFDEHLAAREALGIEGRSMSFLVVGEHAVLFVNC